MHLNDDYHMNIVGHRRVKINFLYGRVKGIDGVLHIIGTTHNLFF